MVKSNAESRDASALLEVQSLLLSGAPLEDTYKLCILKGLWSHAFVLSTQLGPDVIRQTVWKILENFLIFFFPIFQASLFTECTITEGAPLRTLYQTLSGKFPENSNTAAVTASASRWRENLAAILSTPRAPNSSIPPLRRLAGEFGDSLWASARKVEAAHVCYLLADVEVKRKKKKM
jgi:hypothetical protein